MTNSKARFSPSMMLAPRSLGVARARLQAATAGAGSVVHLGGGALYGDAGALYGDADRLPPIPPGGVLLADHVLWATDDHHLVQVIAELKPGQVLVFLEPTADTGWRRAIHWAMARLGPSVWRRVVGHHFERDVPAAVRATGITVTDTVRFNTGPFRAFSYVYGRAVWLEPPES